MSLEAANAEADAGGAAEDALPTTKMPASDREIKAATFRKDFSDTLCTPK